MNINIKTGIMEISVNNDPSRIIRFNPSDITFAERFYGLIDEFEVKEKEFLTKAAKLDENTEIGSLGIKKNSADALALQREICEYLKVQVDKVFGIGTSKAAFADVLEMDMFEQFFDGISPFVQKSRNDKMSKYLKGTKPGVLR